MPSPVKNWSFMMLLLYMHTFFFHGGQYQHFAHRNAKHILLVPFCSQKGQNSIEFWPFCVQMVKENKIKEYMH